MMSPEVEDVDTVVNYTGEIHRNCPDTISKQLLLSGKCAYSVVREICPKHFRLSKGLYTINSIGIRIVAVKRMECGSRFWTKVSVSIFA
jgi:hypothetical protein